MATRNRVHLLRSALAAVGVQRLSGPCVVVDDSSTDETPSFLREMADESGERLIVGRTVRQSGPAVARNIGWRLTHTEWVAFTDDDCVPGEDWLCALVETATREGVDVVQGRTVPAPLPIPPPAYYRTMDVPRFNGKYATCNLLVSRRALEALDGFDESYPFAGEDSDLGWRARKAGFAAAFADDAVVVHAIRPTTFWQRARDRWKWAQLARFYRLHPEARELLYLRVFARRQHAVVAALLVISTASALAFGPGAAMVLWLAYAANVAVRGPGRGLIGRLRAGLGEPVLAVWTLLVNLVASVRHRSLML